LWTNFNSRYEAGLSSIVLSQCPRTGILVTEGDVEMNVAVKNMPKLAMKLVDVARTIMPSGRTLMKKLNRKQIGIFVIISMLDDAYVLDEEGWQHCCLLVGSTTFAG
jgi:hypothetical protein